MVEATKRAQTLSPFSLKNRNATHWMICAKIRKEPKHKKEQNRKRVGNDFFHLKGPLNRKLTVFIECGYQIIRNKIGRTPLYVVAFNHMY